ncbi:short-chain dehydrogenase/reductase [Methylovirgula ligni]|uniref:NADP-dependent 3-hydroxy acid dehydrogenase YdfG n=1 Tax=Methylovirgula ligni TaxID=569860 RepID=A0A3D9Z2X6_9HYPH|nr:SDR family oxidoreductase [Methylovirgula ligni]QAY95483.1 short-chain dehydrogenase/reductase [Methylovirgula ligni]REF89185.1 NADP-dependent 3-hydroxy acid dehydrogenase YdfG [Methylovirgula ligni]
MAKTILITGASSGIGRATALYFAAKGWNVAATMRDPLKADLALKHPQISLFALDVTNEGSIAQALTESLTRYKKIDVLLNNAGYPLFGPIEAVDDRQIQQQFATNVFGLVSVTQQILPVMRKAGEGLIINVSSVVGRMALPYAASYIATKFAVEGLSESMRYELEPFHIRVKLIEPGSVNTEFGTGSMQTAVSDPYRASVTKFLALFAKINAKASEPEAIAEVIYRAANDASNRLRYLAKPGLFFWLNRLLPDFVWRRMLVKAMVK